MGEGGLRPGEGRLKNLRGLRTLSWIVLPTARKTNLKQFRNGKVRWSEIPGEPLAGQIVRFPARENARPTNFLAKLCHCQQFPHFVCFVYFADRSYFLIRLRISSSSFITSHKLPFQSLVPKASCSVL